MSGVADYNLLRYHNAIAHCAFEIEQTFRGQGQGLFKMGPSLRERAMLLWGLSELTRQFGGLVYSTHQNWREMVGEND